MTWDLYPAFRENLEKLLTPAQRKRVALAVSGGPDSMALWDLMERQKKGGGEHVVVHVDHGLRGRSSRADADFVRRRAGALGTPCRVVAVPVRAWAKTHRAGLEEAARILRYRALAAAARAARCTAVLTAHHLDDQVETVFLNLIRGAGPAGLAGMPPVSSWPVSAGGKNLPLLIRPLLGLTREKILFYLKKRKLSFRVDVTNKDDAFFRNRIRPVLKRWDRLRPGFFERVGRLAEIQRDEEDYWEGAWRKSGLARRRKRGGPVLDRGVFIRYHKSQQRRAIRRFFGLSRFDALERARLFAVTPGPTPRISVPGGWIEKKGRGLFFRPLSAPPPISKSKVEDS